MQPKLIFVPYSGLIECAKNCGAFTYEVVSSTPLLLGLRLRGRTLHQTFPQDKLIEIIQIVRIHRGGDFGSSTIATRTTEAQIQYHSLFCGTDVKPVELQMKVGSKFSSIGYIVG